MKFKKMALALATSAMFAVSAYAQKGETPFIPINSKVFNFLLMNLAKPTLLALSLK